LHAFNKTIPKGSKLGMPVTCEKLKKRLPKNTSKPIFLGEVRAFNKKWHESNQIPPKM